MSSPFIWILVPIAAGVLLFFLRHRYRLTVALGTGLTLLLAALAWQLPVDETVYLGSLSFKLGDTLSILGRQFILSDAERPLILAIYLLASIWFAAAYAGQVGRMFVPLGLVITGLLTAVPAVDPFLYAAMLVELIALVAVVMLSRPGHPVGRGVLRFLIFQTLGMIFILFTGWMLTGVEASPRELTLVGRAAAFLGFGFILWLGIFPFHTWVPMVGEEAHPMAAGFVFVMLPFIVFLFGIGLLDRYAWLRNSPWLGALLSSTGVLMVVIGGVWSAFQRSLGRVMGFSVMVEIGRALLAISLPGGLPLFFAMLLPRTAALAVWCLALTVLKNSAGVSMQSRLDELDIKGLAHKLPLTALSLILAHLSLAGLPLLAGFPVTLSLTRMLASSSPLIAVLTLVGTVGLCAGALRSLFVLVQGSETVPIGWKMLERRADIFFLGIGCLALLAIGLFPQFFLPPLADMAQIFERLLEIP